MSLIIERKSRRAFLELESVEECGWPKKDHAEVMQLYQLQDDIGAQANWVEQLIQYANEGNNRMIEGAIENPTSCTDRFLEVLDNCLEECEGLRESALEFENNDHQVVGLDRLVAQIERLSAARQLIHETWPRLDHDEIDSASDDLQKGRFTEYGKVSNEHPSDSGCG